MRNWILKLRLALAGKKTYLAGGALVLVAIAGVASGHMGVVTGLAIGGYGLSMCGYSAKSARQHKELLIALEAAAAAGVAFRAGGLAGVLAKGKEMLPEIVSECSDGEQQ